jgi:CHASE3 domain sensor protein
MIGYARDCTADRLRFLPASGLWNCNFGFADHVTSAERHADSQLAGEKSGYRPITAVRRWGWLGLIGDAGETPMTRPRLAAMGIGGALLLVALIGWVSHQNAAAFMEMTRQVAHTQQTLTALEALLSHLLEAESAGRSHVTTGGEQAREAYRAALAGADHSLERLRHLMGGSANQQQRIGMLKSLLDEKLVLLQHLIEIQGVEGFHPELHSVLGDRGQEQLNQIHWLVETMKAETWAFLLQRHQLEKSYWRMTSVITPLGVGLSAVLLFLALYLFRREIAERSRLQAEWRQARDAAEVTGRQRAEMPAKDSPL